MTYEIEENENRRKYVRKDTSYRVIFQLWGKYPLNWNMNTTQIESAKNLLAEHTLDEVKDLLHKANVCVGEFCPQVVKPSDLDRKWYDLLAFFKKNGKERRPLKSYGRPK